MCWRAEINSLGRLELDLEGCCMVEKPALPQDGLEKLNITTQELPLGSAKGDHFEEQQQKFQPSGGGGDQSE